MMHESEAGHLNGPENIPPWLADALSGRVPSARGAGHAYLIVSDDADGAALFCRRLAMQELCHDDQHGAACFACQSCNAFLQNAHGDLLILERPDGKTAIGVDQVRQATHFLQQTPLYGDLKMLLIRDADQMTLAAANSLLKTLEEPSGNALLLLSTSEAWCLPPTVRSRCQMLRLPLPDALIAEQWLSSQIDISPDDAKQILAMTRGRAVTALGLADSETLSAQHELIATLDQLNATQSGLPAIWSGVELDQLLLRLQIWIEDSVRELAPEYFARDAQSWLLLHRCVCELSARVKQGATPGKDIVVAELFRLCRSREHVMFPSVVRRFFSSLGTQGLAS